LKNFLFSNMSIQVYPNDFVDYLKFLPKLIKIK
jgi:hypothetical protein